VAVMILPSTQNEPAAGSRPGWIRAARASALASARALRGEAPGPL